MFKLILLEDGEEYVADFSATFSLADFAMSAVPVRVRVCSRALYLESNVGSAFLLKFAFKHVETMELGMSDSLQGMVTAVTTIPVTRSVVNGTSKHRVVSAYSTKTGRFPFSLLPTYTSAKRHMPHVFSLWQAVRTLPRHEAGDFVATLVNELRSSRFDYANLTSHREKPLLPEPLFVERVRHLVAQPGLLQITNEFIYFQKNPNFSHKPVKVIKIADIRFAFLRQYLLQPTGLELVLSTGALGSSGVLFVFANSEDRKRVYDLLLANCSTDPNRALALPFDQNQVQDLWTMGLVTNFDYLCALNHFANRSVHDYSQYPVFPWTLRNFTGSQTPDLLDPANFRDLTKPAGASNAEKLAKRKAQLGEVTASGGEGGFLFGTHYSTLGYVAHWLVRASPEVALRVHGGHFDQAARSFRSVDGAWRNVAEGGATLELIPEFYDELDVGWLLNSLNIDSLSDVQLPAWSADFRVFLRTMRMALESPVTSQNLHSWIDLIFGYRSRGVQARLSDNLFHPVTYLETLPAVGEEERKVLMCQIAEFGKTPDQLFHTPHPKRNVVPPLAGSSQLVSSQAKASWSTRWIDNCIEAAAVSGRVVATIPHIEPTKPQPTTNVPGPSAAVSSTETSTAVRRFKESDEAPDFRSVSVINLNVHICVFAASEHHFVCVSKDEPDVLRLVNIAQAFCPSDGGGDPPVYARVLIPGGNILAAAAYMDGFILGMSSGHVHFFTHVRGVCWTAAPHLHAVTSVSVIADDALICGSQDETVRVLVGRADEVGVFDCHSARVTAVSSFHDFIISGDSDGMICVSSLDRGNEVLTEINCGVSVSAISHKFVLFADGRLIELTGLAHAIGHRLPVLSPASLAQVSPIQLDIPVDPVTAILAFRGASRLLIGTAAGSLFVYDKTTRTNKKVAQSLGAASVRFICKLSDKIIFGTDTGTVGLIGGATGL